MKTSHFILEPYWLQQSRSQFMFQDGANTQLSGAAISSTVFEIYAALAASAGAGVRNDIL